MTCPSRRSTLAWAVRLSKLKLVDWGFAHKFTADRKIEHAVRSVIQCICGQIVIDAHGTGILWAKPRLVAQHTPGDVVAAPNQSPR